MSDRRRSASPQARQREDKYRDRRDHEKQSRKKSKTGGFNWKSKGSNDGRASNVAIADKKEVTVERSSQRALDPARTFVPSEPDDGSPEPVPSAPSTIDDDIAAKFGASAARKFASKSNASAATSTSTQQDAPDQTEDNKPKKRKRDRDQLDAPISNQQMMLVTVNDRLGTKAQVPCLASDTVKNFKMLVANRIGRHPHEIMIKRQGHKPFKDALTLADYEVSNGVQLDLELNTGD